VLLVPPRACQIINVVRVAIAVAARQISVRGLGCRAVQLISYQVCVLLSCRSQSVGRHPSLPRAPDQVPDVTRHFCLGAFLGHRVKQFVFELVVAGTPPFFRVGTGSQSVGRHPSLPRAPDQVPDVTRHFCLGDFLGHQASRAQVCRFDRPAQPRLLFLSSYKCICYAQGTLEYNSTSGTRIRSMDVSVLREFVCRRLCWVGPSVSFERSSVLTSYIDVYGRSVYRPMRYTSAPMISRHRYHALLSISRKGARCVFWKQPCFSKSVVNLSVAHRIFICKQAFSFRVGREHSRCESLF